MASTPSGRSLPISKAECGDPSSASPHSSASDLGMAAAAAAPPSPLHAAYTAPAQQAADAGRPTGTIAAQ